MSWEFLNTLLFVSAAVACYGADYIS